MSTKTSSRRRRTHPQRVTHLEPVGIITDLSEEEYRELFPKGLPERHSPQLFMGLPAVLSLLGALLIAGYGTPLLALVMHQPLRILAAVAAYFLLRYCVTIVLAVIVGLITIVEGIVHFPKILREARSDHSASPAR